MISVSITEFRKKTNYYISLSKNEDVQITKYKKVVGILSGKNNDYYNTLNKLYGSLANHYDHTSYKDMIGEEIMRRCGY